MARKDLTNAEIEATAAEEPGSAARYLEERREEAERREAQDKEQFVREFVDAGGTKAEAEEVYRRLRNEEAEKAAVAASEAARQQSRRHISGRL